MNGKKNTVSGSSLFYAPYIPQYNQWPISEYTIARPKEKKFINKPG